MCPDIGRRQVAPAGGRAEREEIWLGWQVEAGGQVTAGRVGLHDQGPARPDRPQGDGGGGDARRPLGTGERDHAHGDAAPSEVAEAGRITSPAWPLAAARSTLPACWSVTTTATWIVSLVSTACTLKTWAWSTSTPPWASSRGPGVPAGAGVAMIRTVAPGWSWSAGTGIWAPLRSRPTIACPAAGSWLAPSCSGVSRVPGSSVVAAGLPITWSAADTGMVCRPGSVAMRTRLRSSTAIGRPMGTVRATASTSVRLPTWRNRLVMIAAETTISSTAPTNRAGLRSRGGGPTRTAGARRGARPPAGGDGAGGPDGGVRVAMTLLSDGGSVDGLGLGDPQGRGRGPQQRRQRAAGADHAGRRPGDPPGRGRRHRIAQARLPGRAPQVGMAAGRARPGRVTLGVWGSGPAADHPAAVSHRPGHGDGNRRRGRGLVGHRRRRRPRPPGCWVDPEPR